MIKTMEQSERDAILAVADLMVTAAKTAPKGSGRDTVVAAVATGDVLCIFCASVHKSFVIAQKALTEPSFVTALTI